jgi:predicted dehydrogenase
MQAVAAGRPASPDFTEGAAVQRLIDAMLASARGGRWLEVGAG